MAAEAKNKKWLGYALYVALVTVILLYFLFPAGAVEEFLDNSTARINPEFSFKAESIGPWVPAGLSIKAGQVYLRNAPDPVLFNTDSLYVGPRILSLVKGEYNFDLKGRAYSGDITGTIRFAGENSEEIAGEISFLDLDLADYGFLQQAYKHRITGSLSGEILYDSQTPGAPGGNGKVDLRLSGGRLQFNEPLLNISSLDLQSIKLEADLSRRQITIIKAELAGSDMNGTITGTIQLQKDIRASQLNLKGTLEPLAEFYKNYPEIRELLKAMKKRVKRGEYYFTVTGTLGAPKFNLL